MFRPSFELLEKREVFSAGSLAFMPFAIPADGPGQQPAEVYVEEISSGFVSHTRPADDNLPKRAANGTNSLRVGPEIHDAAPDNGSARGVILAGTLGRGVVGDFNNDGHLSFRGGVTVATGDVTGDGRTDLGAHNFYGTGFYRSINWGGGNQLPLAFADGSVRFQKQILPIVEQENRVADDLVGWNLAVAPKSGPTAILAGGGALVAGLVDAPPPTASIQLDFDDSGNVWCHKQILPYIEEDNFYRTSDSWRGRVTLDSGNFVSALYQDLLGPAADVAAHDQVFAELDIDGNSLSVDSTPPKILLGLLLPVRQSVQGITVDPHDADTVYLAMSPSTDPAINPTNRSPLIGSDGGVWRKTTR